nr:hypothetical protein [Candidatus Woesearchaeota archaeon]
MDELRKDLEREIKEARISMGKNFYYYFNNFCGILPFGYKRSELYKPYLNEKFLDKRASEKLQNMTLGDFFQDIDNTISEIGLDLDELKRLQEGRDYEGLYKFTLPIYIRLREKGYKPYPDSVA